MYTLRRPVPVPGTSELAAEWRGSKHVPAAPFFGDTVLYVTAESIHITALALSCCFLRNESLQEYLYI